MQAQKLNQEKPYGTVTGHMSITYEQDGKYFDASGDLLDDRPTEAKKEDVLKTKAFKKGTKPADFLTAILANGPMTQSAIKKESDNLRLTWADVQLAAIELGIEKYKQGSANIWKLGETA